MNPVRNESCSMFTTISITVMNKYITAAITHPFGRATSTGLLKSNITQTNHLGSGDIIPASYF